MIQVMPQIRILLAVESVDFRRGIDGLGRVCRDVMNADPFCGYMFVFRNRQRTSIKILMYDGQGFWLCQKRLSKGRLRWWPQTGEYGIKNLSVQELQALLWNGNPEEMRMVGNWKPLGTNQIAP